MSVAEVVVYTVLGLGTAGFVAVVLAVAGWRRSEDEYARWRQRRGEDDHDDDGPPRPTRSHWGGLGRPGA